MPPSNSSEPPKPEGYDTWTDDQRKIYEEHLDRYRLLAAKIYDQNEGKKTRAELNDHAKSVLAEITTTFPDLDKKIVNSFLASIGTMVGMILATPLHDLPEILEHVFNANMLAVTANLGLIDLDAEGGPTVEELVKKWQSEDNISDDDQPSSPSNFAGPYL